MRLKMGCVTLAKFQMQQVGIEDDENRVNSPFEYQRLKRLALDRQMDRWHRIAQLLVKIRRIVKDRQKLFSELVEVL